jgi:hypothetical protein
MVHMPAIDTKQNFSKLCGVMVLITLYYDDMCFFVWPITFQI